MRFGIMTMQMKELIPAGLSPQEMMGYITTFENAPLVRKLHAHGFNLVELGGDLVMFMPQAFAPSAMERLAALKAELGLAYTVHLPLWSVEPSTPLTPVRHGSVRALIDVVRATLPLQPEVYVLHATGALAAEFYRMKLPDLGRAMLMRQFQAGALESLHTLLSETGIPSRQLAIETIEFPLDLTLEMAEQLNLSLCFDTGHVLSGFAGDVEFFDALELCLPRLAEIHLHDAPIPASQQEIVYGKDHSVLGTGDLDLARFLDRLTEVNFNGPIIFELEIEEALASWDVIRGLA
ncbi:MAG TPA: cobamide remodeling phosphodiesterase CbiR [Anaerolineae bacterium]|nr:cobamide remodeling phosphodiesterase CbiR [Anaerolineae bacterium]HQH37297.1 cobamide remodeling phosphodiesterase CbiR [Anaerolineae bacterium]